MPDVNKGKVGEIHENNLEMLDMANTCLHLGIRVEGAPKRWTELDEDDWGILYLLLTRVVLEGQSPASQSKALASLASFAEAASKWYLTHPEGK